ncbi:TPA: hypothetical protein HA335_05950 [Methanocaldococcus jannaschii]|uniref:Uncharacterized protein n=1 Tax=Methanocaldococcus jannaschii TaxID=2190 RepID=A0A832SV76_9EURY|nr:hypothetical protein [Methanocaldococcus jannaschii]
MWSRFQKSRCGNKIFQKYAGYKVKDYGSSWKYSELDNPNYTIQDACRDLLKNNGVKYLINNRALKVSLK